MPRGVKGSGKATPAKQGRGASNYSSQIIEKEREIQTYKDKISELQKNIKELTVLKNKEDANTLLQAVFNSGISVEEAISAIASSK
ncbi:MAG: hypothetical protein LBJ99_05135 [Oscillospiraceae bacterium]|jgi:succinate dehydrogenase/fumarate reductase flavoprotein subunit|nr:hypothetical protein [Oscillospiraceae bacterium]